MRSARSFRFIQSLHLLLFSLYCAHLVCEQQMINDQQVPEEIQRRIQATLPKGQREVCFMHGQTFFFSKHLR